MKAAGKMELNAEALTQSVKVCHIGSTAKGRQWVAVSALQLEQSGADTLWHQTVDGIISAATERQRSLETALNENETAQHIETSERVEETLTLEQGGEMGMPRPMRNVQMSQAAGETETPQQTGEEVIQTVHQAGGETGTLQQTGKTESASEAIRVMPEADKLQPGTSSVNVERETFPQAVESDAAAVREATLSLKCFSSTENKADSGEAVTQVSPSPESAEDVTTAKEATGKGCRLAGNEGEEKEASPGAGSSADSSNVEDGETAGNISQTQEGVLKVCPTAEELQWSSPPTWLTCPAKDCKAFPFKTQQGLNRHVKLLHPDLRPKASTDQENRSLHFHCPDEGCYFGIEFDRWFTSFAKLKSHYLNTHEKRFPCRTCNRRFGLERDRKYHERECGTVHACTVCTAKYPSRQALLTHCLRKQHPVPPKTPKKTSPSKSGPSAGPQCSTCTTKSKDKGSQHTCTQHNSDSSPKPREECSPRKILPKCPVILIAGIPPPAADQDLTLAQPHSRPLIHTSSAKIQTDSAGVGTFCQRANRHGINTACQTVQQTAQHVRMTHMATQASSLHHSDSNYPAQNSDMATQFGTLQRRSPNYQLHISDVGTQASQTAFASVAGSQISDMGIQVSVELVNSGTQSTDSSLVGSKTGIRGNAATQASTSLVHSGTQIDLIPQVSAIAVQTLGGANVTNMAVQATDQLPDFAHIATQATGLAADTFDISIQVSDTVPGTGFPCVMVSPNVMLPAGSSTDHSQPPHPYIMLSKGSNTSTQASLSCVGLNKGSNTSSAGMRLAMAGFPEECETASTGMQTSLTLIPGRFKEYGVIAQTQTSGDHILRSAMASADIPLSKKAGRRSRSKGHSPGRKRSVQSSEVQTQGKRRRTAGVKERAQAAQDYSIATQTSAVQPDSVSMPGPSQTVEFPGLPCAVSRQEEDRWDPFLSQPAAQQTSTSDTGLQADLDDFLFSYTSDFGVQTQDDFISCTSDFGVQTQDDFISSCTTEFGVQTQDDFISACTAEFGVQTQDDFLSACTAEFGAQTQDDFILSCTAELGVQTQNHCLGSGTTDFGIQTATSPLGSLLDDFDSVSEDNVAFDTNTTPEVGVVQTDQDLSISSGRSSMADCGTGTEVSTLDSQTQTGTGVPWVPGFSLDIHLAEMGTEMDNSLSGFPSSASHKLFDSFDSDLSFSDCGTGTEDFFASSHTQTGSDFLLGDSLSTLDCGTGRDDLLSHTHTQTSVGMLPADVDLGSEDSLLEPFLCASTEPPGSDPLIQARSFRRSAPNPPLPNFDCSLSASSGVSTHSATVSSSSSTTDLSAVAASDVHTQTADELLDFLMNNMETQTTEEIADHTFLMADTQTQTSGVLLTPPYALSTSPGTTALSPFENDNALDLVTAQTQTSSQFMMELDEDGDDFFHFADMETQTNALQLLMD